MTHPHAPLRRSVPTQGGAVVVGFSGGMDSTVLLHLLANDTAIRREGLRALHVHHGLQAGADAWAGHCDQACMALGVPLTLVRVRVDRDSGLGPEGAARAARHRAFAQALGDGEILALAHHRDDQAETFLLRALRGSGVDGLAAMRHWRRYAGGWLWRPLLAQPRVALHAYARAHGLHWVEDPGNAGSDPDRNFLRHQVLPLLRERWPHAAHSLARSAVLCAEAADLLDAGDALALADARRDRDTLDVEVLQALPRARRARVLRHWVLALQLPPLPGNGVDRIETALLGARADAQASFDWSGARVQRWRNLLHAGRIRAPLPLRWEQDWDGQAPLALPTGDRLQLLGTDRFDESIRVHARRGGERIRLPRRSHQHSLKQVLQARGIPPWQRVRMPLLSDREGLLAAGDGILSARLQDLLERMLVAAPRQADAFAAAPRMHPDRFVEAIRAEQLQAVAGRQRQRRLAIPVLLPPQRQRCADAAGMQQVPPALHARAGPVEAGLRIGTRAEQRGFDAIDAVARQWRQLQRQDPVAQHARAARARQRLQDLDVEGVAVAARIRQRQRIARVQQVRGLRAQDRAAREAVRGVRPAFAQQRQDLVAQEVAVRIAAGVAGVLDPVQAVRACVRVQGNTWLRKQRPPQPAACVAAPVAHRGQPIHAGAAQCAQQEGLGLVVAVVGEGEDLAITQRLRERAMACGARRALGAEAGIAVDADADQGQRYAQGHAGLVAMPGPGIGARLQAMVHMQRTQALATDRGVVCEQVQQDGGIHPAAEADHDRAALRGHGSPEWGVGVGHPALHAGVRRGAGWLIRFRCGSRQRSRPPGCR